MRTPMADGGYRLPKHHIRTLSTARKMAMLYAIRQATTALKAAVVAESSEGESRSLDQLGTIAAGQARFQREVGDFVASLEKKGAEVVEDCKISQVFYDVFQAAVHAPMFDGSNANRVTLAAKMGIPDEEYDMQVEQCRWLVDKACWEPEEKVTEPNVPAHQGEV